MNLIHVLIKVPNLATDGRLPTSWKRGIFGYLWYTGVALEGAKLYGVHQATLIFLGSEACAWRTMVRGEGNHSSEVKATIPACLGALQYTGCHAETDGRTPWEGVQVIAFEVLSQICQQHGVAFVNSAAGSFRQVDPATIVWVQHDRVFVVRDQDEWALSANPAMSAMFAVMQMFHAREDARLFWQESYEVCKNMLIEAENMQGKLRSHVRKLKKKSRRELRAMQTKLEYDVADRTAAQAEARAAHEQRMQAVQQRDEAYRLAESREEARTRTMVMAGHLENDFRRREAEYQRRLAEYEDTIVELQHDVHRLNNLRDPILAPRAAEMDPAVIVAPDDGAPDADGEEEPEELMMIDESDDEGGHVSGVHSDHDD
jgi:Skp family chaperone for outer membrane proteins